MRPLHRLVFVCFALVFLSGVFSIAQNVASKPLIVEKVNENQLVMLRGNTPPAAIGQNDRGRVSAGMSMSGLVLVLRRSPEQQAAFDAFVASQYDATSPNYHHWLEPEEVGEKFGPAMADIATVSSWLSSHGLAVETVSKDRMTIRFSGTASQVEETFHTEIHNLVVKGEPHISNMSDPQIPMALDPVVLGPKALHNFTPQAAASDGRHGHAESLRKRVSGGPGARTGDIELVRERDAAPGYGHSCCGHELMPVLRMWPRTISRPSITCFRCGMRARQLTARADHCDCRKKRCESNGCGDFRRTFGLPTGGAFNLIQRHGTDSRLLHLERPRELHSRRPD